MVLKGLMAQPHQVKDFARKAGAEAFLSEWLVSLRRLVNNTAAIKRDKVLTPM